VEAARVESDSRNESGAKDRVDSPEQVAGDLERQGEEWPEEKEGGEPRLALTVESWRSVGCRGRGRGEGGGAARLQVACVKCILQVALGLYSVYPLSRLGCLARSRSLRAPPFSASTRTSSLVSS